jgi:nucleotide-binding universal stress UspA family protein
MFKDIVLNLSIDNDRDVTRDYAISVADALQAHLVGVAFAYEPLAVGSIFDGIGASIIETQRAEFERAAKSAASRFDEATRKAAVSREVNVIPASVAGCGEVFGRVARTRDLSIVGQCRPSGSLVDDLIIEGALFGSGRPVLIVPYIQAAPFKVDRVLLCWDGSVSAARAIADSMPFLERSKSIEVVTIADKDDNRASVPGADMAHHLARHGLMIDLKRVVAPDIDVSDAVLSHAADSSADLIVMGGYGHSRFREFVLGGTTRSVLSSMTVPTLMSH